MANTVNSVGDLSADHADAILRDVNCPGDVRAAVQTQYNVQRYLESVQFNDQGDGYLVTEPREEQPEPAAQEGTPDNTWSRDELNKYAADHGVENPEGLSTKADVLAAIEAKG